MKKTVSNKTYTKKDLINSMLEDYTVDTCKLELIVNRIIHLCIQEINSNNVLKITNLGVFYKKTYNIKSGMNFKTKEKINNINIKPVVRCKFSKNFKYFLKNKSDQYSDSNYSILLSEKLHESLKNSGLLIHKDDCYLVVNEFFKTISNILTDLNRIELRHFGVFEIRRYLERRNKKNKDTSELLNNERLVPFFRGSKLSFYV